MVYADKNISTKNQNIAEFSNCLWYLQQIFGEILPELFFDFQKRFREKIKKAKF